MAKDLYEALGVSKGASEDAIRKAFKKLAAQHHPDRNPGKESEARFKELNRAYEVLSDAGKRALYDEFGEESLSAGFDAERARLFRDMSKRPSSGGGAGGMPFNLEDLFGGFGGMGGMGGFGGAQPGRGRPRKGRDVETHATIDFVSAVQGATVTLSRQGGESLTVRVPAGADTGARVRVQGQGEPGVGGGPAGDLVLTLQVTPHPHFRREGDDLHLDVPLTLGEAYRCDRVRIPTPAGEVMLRVPARTQSGQALRLRGKGVARKGRPAGDLYVHFQVHVPTADAPEVAQAVDALEPFAPVGLREHLKL